MQPQVRQPKTEQHGFALFFHWFFKVSALLFYLLSSLFISNFTLTFVVSVILIALDFWTVREGIGIGIFVHINAYAYAHTHTFTHTHTHSHTHTHVNTHTHIHTREHTYTHVNTHTHTHTYTHT